MFEEFIDTCLKFYRLDPCHYFSSPGLSWDAMLKMTGVKLEKISDIDKYLFIEKGLRGGISYITKRYARANNKYMNDYDSKKPSTFITYLDMNNLYGWAMSKYLPYEEFHKLHNYYPLAPEKLAISSDMLSKYCKEIADMYKIKIGDVKKLIPNLGNKLDMYFITEIFSCICH